MTFIYGCLCMSNFDKGLIEAHRKLCLQHRQCQSRLRSDRVQLILGNPQNKSSLWALYANAKHKEKVRAVAEAEGPGPTDRLVIE